MRHAFASWSIRLALVLAIGVGASDCTSVAAATQLQERTSRPPDGIVASSFEAADLDRAVIGAGVLEIQKGTYGNIHSLLIFRDGKLVSENYFPGEDEDNHKGKIGLVHHGPDTLHDIRSISKSVVALAVLIAHSTGHIPSLDRPLFDYFPEYAQHAVGKKRHITVRHALTMTAGLDWNEDVPFSHPVSSPAKFKDAADPLGFVLSRELVAPPGTKFTYNGGLTQVLAAIVHRSTGKDIEQFTRSELLRPLGITRSEWAKRQDGQPDADSGVRLRSRDLAKIGLLLANEGRWRGKQIVPARLIREAIAQHVEIPQVGEAAALGDQQGYGYQIWRTSILLGQERLHLIELSGNGGQKVYIEPAKRLIAVVTAGNYDRRGLKKTPLDIYVEVVRRAVR